MTAREACDNYYKSKDSNLKNPDCEYFKNAIKQINQFSNEGHSCVAILKQGITEKAINALLALRYELDLNHGLSRYYNEPKQQIKISWANPKDSIIDAKISELFSLTNRSVYIDYSKKYNNYIYKIGVKSLFENKYINETKIESLCPVYKGIEEALDIALKKYRND